MKPTHEINNDCVAFAFYGVVGTAESIGTFYNDLIVWFNSVGCPPDKLSVHGTGFGGKPAVFAKTHARLSKQGFSDIKGITVFSMLPDGTVPTLDWWAISSLDLGVALRPYFILTARASITSLEDVAVARLVSSCVSNLNPAYGIGFHRNHDQDPWFYAAGMNFSSGGQGTADKYEEALTVSRWGDLGMVEEVYKQGILRDVYLHNYLSEPQLARRIGKQTLKEWISQVPSRGTLTKLVDRMMLWKVDAEQIGFVREELWKANAILNWKDYL